MGQGTYSTSSTAERSVGEKFVTWLNGITFEDDEQMVKALTEIKSECEVRLSAVAEETEETSKD